MGLLNVTLISIVPGETSLVPDSGTVLTTTGGMVSMLRLRPCKASSVHAAPIARVANRFDFFIRGFCFEFWFMRTKQGGASTSLLLAAGLENKQIRDSGFSVCILKIVKLIGVEPPRGVSFPGVRASLSSCRVLPLIWRRRRDLKRVCGVESDHAVDQLEDPSANSLLNFALISTTPGSTSCAPEAGTVPTTTGGWESTDCWPEIPLCTRSFGLVWTALAWWAISRPFMNAGIAIDASKPITATAIRNQSQRPAAGPPQTISRNDPASVAQAIEVAARSDCST